MQQTVAASCCLDACAPFDQQRAARALSRLTVPALIARSSAQPATSSLPPIPCHSFRRNVLLNTRISHHDPSDLASALSVKGELIIEQQEEISCARPRPRVPSRATGCAFCGVIVGSNAI